VKKLLDFNASISDVKKVNPLFSTCRVRVMYTGENRNMSTIDKGAVEKALPTIYNIPIVGEFSEENKDFKGHGGAIDLSDYKFIHTTKPFGVVPESATYEWVPVKGADGTVHEYLEIDNCYLWTGRYEEAESIIQNGKGQSMEIEVNDGKWDDKKQSFVINDFTFSALCILGDDVEPCFEGANITAYSLDKDTFRREFSMMMNELKSSLSQNKEVNDMEKLKELLEQYSIKMEDVTASGIVLDGLSEEDMVAKFEEQFGNKGAKNKDQKTVTIDPNSDDSENKPADEKGKKPVNDGDPEDATDGGADEAEEDKKAPKKKQMTKSGVGEEDKLELEPVIEDDNGDDPSSLKGEVEEIEQKDAQFKEDSQKADVKEIKQDGKFTEEAQSKIDALEDELFKIKEVKIKLEEENQQLKAFKLQVETAEKEAKVEKLFNDFQLTAEDVQGIEIHNFSLEEIEEKCYAIVGRKLASKKNFAKEDKGIHLPLNNNGNENNSEHSRYGNLFSK
jgi:hypothetical protein